MKVFNFVFIVMLLLFVYGCKNEEPPAEAIEADVYEYFLVVGDTEPININVHSYYKNKIVIFQSENEAIATVEGGVIKAEGVGTTIIKAFLEDIPNDYIEIKVNVSAKEVKDSEIPELVLAWIKKEIGSELWQPKLFPTSYPLYDVEIEYESANPEVLTNEGITCQMKYDVIVDLSINVTYQGFSVTDIHQVVVVGYIFAFTSNTFFSQLPSHGKIMNDYEIKVDGSAFEYPEVEISWQSSNENVFTNGGEYKKPFNDTNFEIILFMRETVEGVTKEYRRSYTALGVSIGEKGETIEKWLIAQGHVPQIVTDDLELPLYYDDEFEAKLEWSVSDNTLIGADGKITPKKIDTLTILTCKVSIGDKATNINFTIEIPSQSYENKWDAIEAFLDEIFIAKIKNQKYTMSGIAPGFPAYNLGYVPFYTNKDLELVLDILPVGHAMRPGRVYERKYVVIHDTANNTPNAGALMHSNYLKTTTRVASWHYTVDDTIIYQHIPDNEEAWHAGDAEGNRYGIGIETCVNPEVDYTVVMRKTAKLAAQLLYRYDLSLKDIRQHYDFTKKDCPYVMRHSNRWGEFLTLTAIEYTGIKNFADVQFTWESLSKNIMDNTGRIHNHPGVETNVTYKVTVIYDNETRVYNHTSILLPPSWM